MFSPPTTRFLVEKINGFHDVSSDRACGGQRILRKITRLIATTGERGTRLRFGEQEQQQGPEKTDTPTETASEVSSYTCGPRAQSLSMAAVTIAVHRGAARKLSTRSTRGVLQADNLQMPVKDKRVTPMKCRGRAGAWGAAS